jgi:hypothetical protein
MRSGGRRLPRHRAAVYEALTIAPQSFLRVVHATVGILATSNRAGGIDRAAEPQAARRSSTKSLTRGSTERVAGLAADGPREARRTGEAGAIRKGRNRTLSPARVA